jgi:SAM-dependent methyltransferase
MSRHTDQVQLDDQQLEAFDQEYVSTPIWTALEPQLRRHLGAGPARMLDIGGGNGMFADRMLEAFDELSVVVLEPAANLAEANTVRQRKHVVVGGTADLDGLDGTFDLICFNWVLHHLVGSDAKTTDRLVADAFIEAAARLSPTGNILVIENDYRGAVADDLPGRLIFELTSSKALTTITTRLGANTAGVGVRFRSNAAWRSTFLDHGLLVAWSWESEPWPTFPRVVQLGLLARRPRHHVYLLRPR